MRFSVSGRALLVSAYLLAEPAILAQQSYKPAAFLTDLAVTLSAERSRVVSDDNFWFKGGGADMAVTFWKGLGLAAVLIGDHAGNVQSGVDVNKLSYLAGPRVTYTAWRTARGGYKSLARGWWAERMVLTAFIRPVAR